MAGTRAERLHALIAKVAPTAAEQHAKTGTWPQRPSQNPEAAADAAAPYVLETLPGGRRRVRVISEDGDVVSGVGATLDDAIAALEAKLA